MKGFIIYFSILSIILGIFSFLFDLLEIGLYLSLTLMILSCTSMIIGTIITVEFSVLSKIRALQNTKEVKKGTKKHE